MPQCLSDWPIALNCTENQEWFIFGQCSSLHWAVQSRILKWEKQNEFGCLVGCYSVWITNPKVLYPAEISLSFKSILLAASTLLSSIGSWQSLFGPSQASGVICWEQLLKKKRNLQILANFSISKRSYLAIFHRNQIFHAKKNKLFD